MSKRRQFRPPRFDPEPAYRADGWFNVATGLGTKAHDKRRHAHFESKRVHEYEAEDLWRGDDICATIVEEVPRTMLRNGFSILIGDTTPTAREPQKPLDQGRFDSLADTFAANYPKGRNRLRRKVVRRDSADAASYQKALAQKHADLKTTATFIQALEYARAFGGSAILLGTDELRGKGNENDLLAMAKPLDLTKVKDVKWLKVLRPHECWPIDWYRDPTTQQFGTPRMFRIVRDTMGGTAGHVPFRCHESRLIRFYGIGISIRQMAMNNGWGDSILIRHLEQIADFHQAFQANAIHLLEFSQGVLSVEGLSGLIAAKKDDVVTNRLSALAMMRAVNRLMVIDAKEKFERPQTPMSGFAESLDRAAKRLAASIRMPVTRLMGESPAGLNATGENDVRAWYDEVAMDREFVVRPRFNYLQEILFNCSEGPTDGVEPEQWRVEFHPLWQMSEVEQADVRLKTAQADAASISAGVYTAEEAAESHYGGDGFSMEIKLDRETRDKMEKAHAAGMDLAQKAGVMPNPSPNSMVGEPVTPEAKSAQIAAKQQELEAAQKAKLLSKPSDSAGEVSSGTTPLEQGNTSS